MKIKDNKKKHHRKAQKKSSSILVLDNNYHEKKNDNKELEDKKNKLDEQSYKDKLKEIYDLIKNKNYERKPIDVYINNIDIKLIKFQRNWTNALYANIIFIVTKILMIKKKILYQNLIHYIKKK